METLLKGQGHYNAFLIDIYLVLMNAKLYKLQFTYETSIVYKGRPKSKAPMLVDRVKSALK